MQMADLFDVTPQNITIHLKKVYAAGELEREATSKDFLLVQTEGGRQITRSVNCYSLDAIISVGYRVNSTRATQFRIWATRILKDYIVRGYAINRERMRQLGQTVEVMKRVADHTLVALTVMIAESKPQEKELMVHLVLTFLKRDSFPAARDVACPHAPPMGIIFCCFSERDKKFYEALIHG